MMINRLVFLGCFFISTIAIAQIKSTSELIDKMMSKSKGEWFDSYTFIQKTIKYDKNGAQRGEVEIWYEAIKYPDKFRIDYGHPREGNAAIYRNDSAYIFKNNVLERREVEYQEFLLLEGGMHQLKSSDKVMARLREFGYDLSKFYTSKYNGRKVYVFGAEPDDLKSKQMWIDAKHFYIARKIEPFREKYTLETRYGDFKKYGPAWIENKVSFYIDGNLVQDEYYENVDIKVTLKDELFDPAKKDEWHWLEE